MTLFYPDISSFQSGLNLSGAAAVCCKATQSNNYTNPTYAGFQNQAANKGIFFFAYHFLTSTIGAQAQAQYCFNVVGPNVPLMLDVESTTGSEPNMTSIVNFVTDYRLLGGTCELVYFPNWYWGDIGSPNISGPFGNLFLDMVSSDYTTYSDTGPGWNAYGGQAPAIWQYTDAQAFNGQDMDFNAFKGTLADFELLVNGPTRQITPGGESLEAIAVSRGANAVSMFERSEVYWTTADLNTILGLTLPAGFPLYTANSGEQTLPVAESINAYAASRGANAMNLLTRSIADYTTTDINTIINLTLPAGFPYYTANA